MAKYIIREGKREDCKEIRRLIEALADYHQKPNDVKTSVEDLEREGFDTEYPRFYTYVVNSEDEPGVLVGYALYHYAYGTWTGRKVFLREFYVSASLRGLGIGTALIRKVFEKTVEMNCEEFDFFVAGWNKRSQEFYFKLGAVDISETEKWRIYRQNSQKRLSLYHNNKSG